MLQLIESAKSVLQLVEIAVQRDVTMEAIIQELGYGEKLAYDFIYDGKSDWQLLPCFDYPEEPLKCMLSGTGLTHKASAENRQKMHDAASAENLTDSMRMYLIGLENGKPGNGEIGAQPEWFYKGNGSVLRGHRSHLDVPAYAEDGGEEPEIAGIYYCDSRGIPYRIGFAAANEFSDHVMERRNYLYLAPSKIRHCAIGPELVVGEIFDDISGNVQILRSGRTIWSKEIRTGEMNMAHSLNNLEYHHFKYENHRQPGMAHIHFFGADAFSFGEGVTLKDGDEMQVSWERMGRALKNTIRIDNSAPALVPIKSL
jgi:hypothetical protein